MIFCDKNNKMHFAKSENERLFFGLLQELKLFKQENPLDIEAGIDYIAIFNGTAFLQVEFNKIINKHKQNFASLELGSVVKQGDYYSIGISAVMKDGTILNETLELV